MFGEKLTAFLEILFSDHLLLGLGFGVDLDLTAQQVGLLPFPRSFHQAIFQPVESDNFQAFDCAGLLNW